MNRTIIKSVKIYDGSGSKPFISDVLIENEVIKEVKKNLDISNNEKINIIEGKGLCLCPGFINTHSHSDLEVFRNPEMKHVIRQGITTELVGQDGSSVVPVCDDIVEELADNVAPLAGVLQKPYWWRTFNDYMAEVKKVKPYVRIESLVGHGTIRMCVMENKNRKPTQNELIKMKKLVEESLQQGAKGVSLGLIYPPGSYADDEELVEICKIVAQYDGIVMVHMRNEQDLLLESIDSMLNITKKSGIRLHISHLKVLGYKNWGKAQKALEKIELARKEGLDVTFDQYPYIATCTGLKVLIPMWAYEGGETEFQKRILNCEEYAKIFKKTKENIKARGGEEKIYIASVDSKKNKWMSSKNLKHISEKLDMDAAETVIWILKEEGPSVVAIYFSINEEDVKTIMKSSLQSICTDGIVGKHPHPRTYGAFPRVLGHYCRELNLMSTEEAIRKMTFEPARRLRLWDRGLIRNGMSADLVLFDDLIIKDNNSFMEPKKFPIGIRQVWIKGKETIVKE